MDTDRWLWKVHGALSLYNRNLKLSIKIAAYSFKECLSLQTFWKESEIAEDYSIMLTSVIYFHAGWYMEVSDK